MIAAEAVAAYIADIVPAAAKTGYKQSLHSSCMTPNKEPKLQVAAGAEWLQAAGTAAQQGSKSTAVSAACGAVANAM